MVAKLLIIDECQNKRIVTELRNRGRESVSNAELGYVGLPDGELLRKIADEHGDSAILVTADDNMPAEHTELITALGSTLATIDPAVPQGLRREKWEREVVHRWAHRMAVQPTGTTYRYGLSARPWKRRVRPVRRG